MTVNHKVLGSSPKRGANEGCLSLPGIIKEVKRSIEIIITYTDLQNKKHKINYYDLAARAIQHEYDHLNGIFIIDKK